MAKQKDPNYADPILLPDARTGWSHLDEPDTGGKTKSGRAFSKPPTWDVQLLVDDSPAWAAVIEMLTLFENDRRKAMGFPEVDVTTALKTDKEGNKILQPYSRNKDKFVVVDRDKQPWTSWVSKGSLVSTFVQPLFSELKPSLVLYLSGVQVLEAGGGGGGTMRDPFAARGPTTAPAAPQRPVQAATGDPFAKVK